MAKDLSLVVATRNDDYGGRLLERVHNFIKSISKSAARTNGEVEVIFVEWNPPADKPDFREAMNWPDIPREVEVRNITVPSAVHNSIPGSDDMPMFEYWAKNVGIKRARGDFVLATNPDIIFNSEMVDYLVSNLDGEYFYRANRYDINIIPDCDLNYNQMINQCQNNVYSIKTRFNASRPGGANDRKTLNQIKYIGSRIIHSMKYTYRSVHPKMPQYLNSYTHYAGDFLLTTKENWNEIRGFPEGSYNWHADRIATLNLASQGLKQEIIAPPARIYHQEHENMHSQRPQPDLGELLTEGGPSEGGILLQNDEDWGLSGSELVHHTVS